MTAWHRLLPPLACLLASAPARGEETAPPPAAPSPLVRCVVEAPQPCMVVTRSGAIFVGQLTALSPGKRLHLRLVTREERVVAWDEVTSAQPAVFTPIAAVGPQDAAVVTTVEGMQPSMRIEQRPRGLAEEAPWGPLCRLPCTQLELYPGYDYRVADSQGLGTPEFEVPREVTAARLRVRHGSLGRRRAGLGLIITGSILTATAIPLAYMYILNQSSSSFGDRQSGQIALGVLSGLGVPALAGGIALFITGSTRAELTPILAGSY